MPKMTVLSDQTFQTMSEGYEHVTTEAIDTHTLRIKEPETKLCESADVGQYSGYLDITDKRHLFFWYFESASVRFFSLSESCL